MRDSNVSDALDRIMTGEKSTRSQGFTLCPHWLDRLMGRADAFEEPVALPIVDGSVAGFAKVQAQALKAHLRGDRNGAKNACWWLASQLADADRHLAEALGYGREALELGGEESWREQISRWLERVGAPREAASVLAPNVHVAAAASIAAKLLMRMARLQIRGGALQEAMENLLEAATVWPTSADALELAGELAAVQGESTATTMWLEAADRHDQNGNRARAFEARRRAFALSPASAQACDALVDTLEQSGRFQAADETRLLHANAIDGSASRAVHAIRLSRALEAEDSARALAVIVQGRLETVIAGSVAAQVDEALTQAGLHDAVTARWEWAASTEQGTSKARKLLDIAGIYLGRLASPDRALDAWIEAVAADPGCGEARASLRTHARAMRDDTPLVEALIRAVQANPHGPAAIGCYRELATLAEERLSDPSLAHWALTELLIRMDDPQLESTRAALVPRIKLQDNALASAATAVEQGNTEAKLEGWRRMASILRGRPQEIQRYIEVLTHLVRLDREQSRWWLDLERATVRCGRQDHFERMVLERLEDPIAPNEKLHWLVTLMTHAWRRGDPQSALSLAQRLTETLPGMRASHAHAWIAASATGDEELRALALEHLAPNLSASVRATMLSLAATQWEALGNQEQAQRLMWQAKEADEGAPELLRLIASHAARSKDPALLRSLEKLASIFVPTRENHATMTSLLSHAGNGDLAHAWARRWIELCPWDPEVAEQLLQTGVASTTEMHAAAILRVAACVFPTSDMERMLCGGLAELLSRDVHRAAQVAAELADMWGSHSEVFRETLLAVALEAQDLRREAKIVERWLAHTTAPRQELLRLAKIYGDLDDREGQALALVRAARASIEPHEILARLEPMQESISGDAALWILEARARCLAASGDTEGSALAWLHLGSARWDHAHDPVGAIEAWLEAMGHDALAFARLSESLAQRTTAEEVSDAFQDYALACTDPVRRACAFVVAAARAIGLERWTEAADLALQALREDPRRTDALTLIEVASGQGANHQAIDEAHRLAAAGAKGRFGKRASHLRAARVLEARGFSEMALTHAIAAFEADPMQGSALTIMQRLAQQENVADVVDCLCNVAENTQADQRALWWMQAATIASNHAQHQRRALDLGLRALLESPSVEAMELIGRVLESLLRVDKEESSIFELRLQRALKALAPKLEGPIGARIAVSAATISVIILNAYSLALQWARAALACSGDIDEYDRLVALVPQLVMDKEGCGLFIQELIQRVRDRSGTTGPSLMAFAHRLSEALGDGEWVRALRELEAETASDSSQPMDPFADLADAISVDSTPPEPTKSQPEQDPSPKEAISDSAVSSRDGAMPTGQTDRLALADELVERGQEREAIEVLERMGADTPNAQVDRRLRERYEALGLHERLVALLERMASQLDDPAEKVPLLVQVGALRDKLGDKEQARAMWNLVVEVAPETREAWLRLEQDAMERGEWELLAHLLQRHSTVTPSASEAQALQLRRVQLLDRSLMMSERAQGELDELIARGAANSAMLVYRAELAERLEGKLSAAGYWVRAAMLADDRSEAVPLLCGAARAYLDLGVYDKAQQALEQIGDVRTEQVLTLKLEAELGDSGPTARRGDLLDELSAVSNAQPSHRAGWLMEAAEIAMLKGDSHRALDRARRAAALVPSDTEIQLRVVFMTYRLEGLSDR
ncbi:MAG TPA: hypothetical protein PKL73_22740, partial [Polyangiaceae bacterium]|nr:hypothetical protein [Polyangiaceae bacterium]